MQLCAEQTISNCQLQFVLILLCRIFWLCALNVLINLVYSYEIKCRHGYNKHTLSCVFNYLDDNRTLGADMPSDFRPLIKNISHVTLGIANLTALPNDTFDILPNLHSLSARADVQTLSRQNFKSASSLMILNFGYNNRLVRLEARLFEYAPSLQYIDFGFNQIDHIEDGAFEGLSDLQTLYLEANLLTTITNGTFQGISNLTRLDVSKNQIRDIETGSFVYLPKLKTLNLNQNRISKLEAGIFSGFRAIERIDMAVNVISEIEEGAFGTLPTLKILELGFNRLHTLPDDLFGKVPHLHSLFLASNQFDKVPDNLHNLTGLKVMDLSFNPIYSIDSDTIASLYHLESLEMRGCNLSAVSVEMFQNKSALEILDLSENNLTTIDWSVFAPLQQVKILKLTDNKISEMDNFTEIKTNMPKLVFINLALNEIDCDTITEMIEYLRNNTIEYEFGEEVDVGCQLLPLSSRHIQAYQLSNAKFNEEALKLINYAK